MPSAAWIILAIGLAWAMVILAHKVPERRRTTNTEENEDAR